MHSLFFSLLTCILCYGYLLLSRSSHPYCATWHSRPSLSFFLFSCLSLLSLALSLVHLPRPGKKLLPWDFFWSRWRYGTVQSDFSYFQEQEEKVSTHEHFFDFILYSASFTLFFLHVLLARFSSSVLSFVCYSCACVVCFFFLLLFGSWPLGSRRATWSLLELLSAVISSNRRFFFSDSFKPPALKLLLFASSSSTFCLWSRILYLNRVWRKKICSKAKRE